MGKGEKTRTTPLEKKWPKWRTELVSSRNSSRLTNPNTKTKSNSCKWKWNSKDTRKSWKKSKRTSSPNGWKNCKFSERKGKSSPTPQTNLSSILNGKRKKRSCSLRKRKGKNGRNSKETTRKPSRIGGSISRLLTFKIWKNMKDSTSNRRWNRRNPLSFRKSSRTTEKKSQGKKPKWPDLWLRNTKCRKI